MVYAGIAIIAFLLLPSAHGQLCLWCHHGFIRLSPVPLTNGIVANMFGVKYLTMLSGIVFVTHQVGSFFGGWLGGVNHDIAGNYNAVWMLSIVLSIFGVLVHFWVNEEQIVHD